MKTPLLCILTGFVLLTSNNTFAQNTGTWDLGISYRYIRYNELTTSFTRFSTEYLNPNELDAHLRFDIGDPHLKGTLNLGWARYEATETRYDNVLWADCNVSPVTYHIKITEQHAFRFNPGIEYTIRSKGKFSYGCGAGIFLYGTFKGNSVVSDFGYYQHQDSLTGECIEDSSFTFIGTARAEAKPVQLVGLTGHMYAGYEAITGLTFFAMFNVNPMFSTSEHNFALAPGFNAGVYFRFRNPMKTGT